MPEYAYVRSTKYLRLSASEAYVDYTHVRVLQIL